MNHLLHNYATDDIMGETDIKIAPYVKLLSTSPLQFANELWIRTVRCPHLYDEYVLKWIFAEGLLHSIRHNARSCWSSQKTGLWQKVAYRATSLENVNAPTFPGVHPYMNKNTGTRLIIFTWFSMKGQSTTLELKWIRCQDDQIVEKEVIVAVMIDAGIASLINLHPNRGQYDVNRQAQQSSVLSSGHSAVSWSSRMSTYPTAALPKFSWSCSEDLKALPSPIL